MKRISKNKKNLILAAAIAVFSFTQPSPVYASEQGLDPKVAIKNLTGFVLDIVVAIGVIALIWGAVQLALSLKSQDASQRTNAMLFIAGGAIMVGVKFVLQAIGVTV